MRAFWFDFRLGCRVLLAGYVRTILLTLMIAVPIAASVSGVLLGNAITLTHDEAEEKINQGDYSTIGLIGTGEEVFTRAEALLDPGQVVSRRVNIGAPGIAVSSVAATISVNSYQEQDWRKLPNEGLIRFEQGGYPLNQGTVALASPAAADLGVRVGDYVYLGFTSRPLEVSGIYLEKLALQRKSVIGALGLWDTLPAPRFEYLGADRMLVIDGGDESALDKAAAKLGDLVGVVQPSEVPEPVPFYFRQVWLVVTPIVLTLIVSVVAGLMVRFRRLRSDLTIISSLGLAPERIRRMLVTSTLSVVVFASLLGSILGGLTAQILADWFAGLADRDVADWGIPYRTVSIIVCLVGVVSVGLSSWLSSAIVRDSLAGFAGRPASDNVNVRDRSQSRRRLVQGLAGATAIAVAVVGLGGLAGALIFTSTLSFALVSMSVDLLKLTGRLGRGRVWVIATATALATRDRVRASALACTALLTISFPVAVLADQSSRNEAVISTYLPSIPDNQIRVRTLGQSLDGTALTLLSDAAGAPVIPLRILATEQSSGSASPMQMGLQTQSEGLLEVVVVDSIDNLLQITGYRATGSDEAALLAGQVVVLAGSAAGNSSGVLLPSGDRPSSVQRTINVPVSGAEGYVSPAAAYVAPAVLLSESLANLELTSSIQDYRIPNGVGKIDDVVAAGLKASLPPSAFMIDRGPTLERNISAELTLWLSGAIAVLATGIISASSARERRKAVSVLWSLGASSAGVRSVVTLTSSLPTVVGVILGAVAGLLSAAMILSGASVWLSVPWLGMLVVGVGSIAGSIAGSLAGSRISSRQS